MTVERIDGDSAALVFVYGSLKRGQRHHDQMVGCRWQGEAELGGLALHDLGPFPMAVPCCDGDSRLQGEVYAVPSDRLAELDRFEGVPRLYTRQRARLSDGRPVWVYVGRAAQVRHAPRLADGSWTRLALMVLLLAPAGIGRAADLRHDCLSWQRAHGREQVAIADRIGREQLLTRAHQPHEVPADGSRSLYSWSDIQRLCRR